MSSVNPSSAPTASGGGTFLVVCVRSHHESADADEPGGYRWLRRAAKRRMGSLLLRSPSRSIFIWRGMNDAGLHFAQAVLRAAKHCSIGLAFGDLVPTSKADAPNLWGRAAVVATRLSEAASGGRGFIESNLADTLRDVGAGGQAEIPIGKELVQAREWVGELAPISVSARRAQLREWISNVEHLPDKAELVLRLDALARLAEGQSGEALSSLRGAALSAREPTNRCRASLAYAVALSAVGRNFESMLEAMHALGSAREGADERGELACIRFLEELARASGQLEAREVLSRIG